MPSPMVCLLKPLLHYICTTNLTCRSLPIKSLESPPLRACCALFAESHSCHLLLPHPFITCEPVVLRHHKVQSLYLRYPRSTLLMRLPNVEAWFNTSKLSIELLLGYSTGIDPLRLEARPLHSHTLAASVTPTQYKHSDDQMNFAFQKDLPCYISIYMEMGLDHCCPLGSQWNLSADRYRFSRDYRRQNQCYPKLNARRNKLWKFFFWYPNDFLETNTKGIKCNPARLCNWKPTCLSADVLFISWSNMCSPNYDLLSLSHYIQQKRIWDFSTVDPVLEPQHCRSSTTDDVGLTSYV